MSTHTLFDVSPIWYQNYQAIKLKKSFQKLSDPLLTKILIKKRGKFTAFVQVLSFIKLPNNMVRNFLICLSKVSNNSWYQKIRKIKLRSFLSMWYLNLSENGQESQPIQEIILTAINSLFICLETLQLRANLKS